MPNTQTGENGTSSTGGASQGGGSGAAHQTPDGKRRAKDRARSTERREAVPGIADRFIVKYGTMEKALEQLAGELWDLRDERRDYEDKIADLEARQVPTDGVVLTGDDRQAWEKIKAAATEQGTTPAKVPERLKLAKELEGKDAQRSLTESRAAVAKAAQLNPLVLDPLLSQFALAVEVRKEKVPDGKGGVVDGEVAYVRKADDEKAPWEKLADFIAKDGSPLKPFAAALAAKPGQGSGTGNAGGSTSTGNSSTSDGSGAVSHAFPVMTGGNTGDSATTGDPAVDFLNRRNAAAGKRANPFLTPPAATK